MYRLANYHPDTRNANDGTAVMVVVMVVMPMPFDHDHTAMVMMVVMILGELHAFDGRQLCKRCVIGIQRRHRIGNRRQQIGVGRSLQRIGRVGRLSGGLRPAHCRNCRNCAQQARNLLIYA